MANLPLPQTGQPVDSNYIYQIVNAINEISTKMSSTFSQSQFNNGSVSEAHRLNDLSVVAGYVDVVSNTAVDSAKEYPFKYNFDKGFNFKYPPVVTATAKIIVNTEASRDVSVVINEVETSFVSGYVLFNSTVAKQGKASVGVNIIAVGVPNS